MKPSTDEKRKLGMLRDKSQLSSINVSTQVKPALKRIIQDRIDFLGVKQSKYIRDLIIEDLDDCGISISGKQEWEYWQ